MLSSFVDVISSSGGLIKTENGMIYNINFFLRNSAKETGISSWSKVVEGVQNCREKKCSGRRFSQHFETLFQPESRETNDMYNYGFVGTW